MVSLTDREMVVTLVYCPFRHVLVPVKQVVTLVVYTSDGGSDQVAYLYIDALKNG